MATKVEARRWLDAHVGQRLDTCKVMADNRRWYPGFRTLAAAGKTQHTLDGSYLPNLSSTDVEIVQVGPDELTLRDWSGTTTYSTLPFSTGFFED